MRSMGLVGLPENRQVCHASPAPVGDLPPLHPVLAVGVPLVAGGLLVAGARRRPDLEADAPVSGLAVHGGLLRGLPAGLPGAVPRLPRRVVLAAGLLPGADRRARRGGRLTDTAGVPDVHQEEPAAGVAT